MSPRDGRSSSLPAKFGRGRHRVGLLAVTLLLAGLCAGVVLVAASGHTALAAPSAVADLDGGAKLTENDYVVLAWNDLGMHCYNRDYDDLAVLPPWNTLWAQVIKIGESPQIVTTGITVEFFLEDNTTSTSPKSNFWAPSPHAYNQGDQNALLLFGSLMGFSEPLPDDIGLTGTGLSGTMEVHVDHFVAEGIPLTEFSDDLVNPEPYQLATVIVRDAVTREELARTQPVAPVSTEMHCDTCHYDFGPGNMGIHTGVVEQNILEKHDRENGDEYPGNLMDRRPILCAECHSSNALGAPGVAGVPSLSNAMHEKHTDEVADTLEGCYHCHPGPETRCLRDVMAADHGMECVDCHGGMSDVASEDRVPWKDEPACADAGCHDDGLHDQDQDLYRESKGHEGVYCAGCHDSPHAIAESREPADAIKFIGWQGYAGNLDNCIVCHSTLPAGSGPHDQPAGDIPFFTFAPDSYRTSGPATQEIYTHTVENAGNVADVYQLAFTSSQEWATVESEPSPLDLAPGATGTVTVTITIPEGGVEGLTDRTVVTATSSANAALFATVFDRTMVPQSRIYLPIILRGF